MSKRVTRAVRLAAIAAVAVSFGALAGCSSYVIPGTSLTSFESEVEAFVLDSIGGGTAGSAPGYGNVSVRCALPASWIAGETFTCYAYGAETYSQSLAPAVFGTVTVTILSTQPGSEWNANFVWQPQIP